MGWLEIIGIILKFVWEVFNLWQQKDAEIKAHNKEALKDAIEAIDARDADRLNRAFEQLR